MIIIEDEEVKMNEMEQNANNIEKKAFNKVTENILYILTTICFIVTGFIKYKNKDIDMALLLFGMLYFFLILVIVAFCIGILIYKWFYRNNLEFQLAEEILKGYKERIGKGKAKVYLEVQLENSNKIEKMREYIKNMRKRRS